MWQKRTHGVTPKRHKPRKKTAKRLAAKATMLAAKSTGKKRAKKR